MGSFPSGTLAHTVKSGLKPTLKAALFHIIPLLALIMDGEGLPVLLWLHPVWSIQIQFTAHFRGRDSLGS